MGVCCFCDSLFVAPHIDKVLWMKKKTSDDDNDDNDDPDDLLNSPDRFS